ncbi:Hypothetical protein CINCED_3A014307 [Cinara cedri]|uniref:Uncharacterized protein n=1 Tax=Cinara cedri TaxID=506608 RepID=A0A5E4N3I8_9HEMI|nr:Hypothetical protein CINCED_3A014307 [Cinara cedri]
MKLIPIVFVVVLIVINSVCAITPKPASTFNCFMIERGLPDIPKKPNLSLENIMSMYKIKETDFARHHVIPWSTIKTFFNLIITNKGVQDDLCGIADEIMNRLLRYTSLEDSENVVIPDSFDNNIIMKLILAVDSKQMMKTLDNPNPTNIMRDIHTFFNWLPANIFIGPAPKFRSDDPGHNIELNAKFIIGENLFEKLNRANNLMTSYIKNHASMSAQQKKTSIQEVVNVLKELLNFKKAMRFRPKNWARDVKTGKWRINTSYLTKDDAVHYTIIEDEQIVAATKNRNNNNKCTYNNIYNDVSANLKTYCVSADKTCKCKN